MFCGKDEGITDGRWQMPDGYWMPDTDDWMLESGIWMSCEKNERMTDNR